MQPITLDCHVSDAQSATLDVVQLRNKQIHEIENDISMLNEISCEINKLLGNNQALIDTIENNVAQSTTSTQKATEILAETLTIKQKTTKIAYTTCAALGTLGICLFGIKGSLICLPAYYIFKRF